MSSGLDNILKDIIVLLENFLESDHTLIFKEDSINLCCGASADDTLGDGNTFLSWVMRNVIRAFVSVTTTVVFVSSGWIFVALLTEVGISAAAEVGGIATEVTLELEVAEAVLVAHELLTDVHILQSAMLTHKGLFIHSTLLVLEVLNFLLGLTINIATEEWTMAALALIKLGDVKGILHRLLEEFAVRSGNTLIIVKVILSELVESFLGQLAL